MTERPQQATPTALGFSQDEPSDTVQLSDSLVPSFPVYGFTFPLVLQLSLLVALGLVAWLGWTYVPLLFAYPLMEWLPLDEEEP
jgi:hypothetical protein